MGRRADLKTGYDCNSNCVFCVIGDKLFTGDRSTRDCIDELRQSRRTCDGVVFTGAEVTIRRDFFTLVRAASKLGYRTIQVQTNGRMLAYDEFCRRAIEAGANEFSPSIHGHTARIHDALVRSKGSFDQVVACIRNLVARGQRVVTNTVVTRRNARDLPALARLLVELGVDQFQLAFPHPTGHAATHFAAVVPSISEVAPYVHAALSIGVQGGVACMAEAFPFCQMRGHEPRVAELHIPPTEIVYDGYVVPDYTTDRINRGKRRFEQCATCRYEPSCEGPWREYPARMGSSEFQPVAGPRVVDTAMVLDDRFDMLGSPAPRWPGRRDGVWTAVMFFPEAGSPGCTAQVCSVQAGYDALRDRGVEVVGISPDDDEREAAFARHHRLGFRLVADPRGDVIRAFRAGDGGDGGRPSVRRSTVLVDPDGRIAHVIVEPDVAAHARQILDALDRLHAAPRPIGPGSELVRIRRTRGAAAEVTPR